ARAQAGLPATRGLGRRGRCGAARRAPRPRLPRRGAARDRARGGVLVAIEAGGAPLAERLRPLLARRARGEEAAELATFARLLFARGGAYAEELAPEEAAALVASAFRFLSAPGPELRVRALTPDYASEGWDAPVSIIETVMPDRAFIVDTIRLRLERAGVPLMALLHPIFAARRGHHAPAPRWQRARAPPPRGALGLPRRPPPPRAAGVGAGAALPGPAPDRRQDDRGGARPPPRAHGRPRREAARPRRASGGRA